MAHYLQVESYQKPAMQKHVAGSMFMAGKQAGKQYNMISGCRSWEALGSYWQKSKFIFGLLWSGLTTSAKDLDAMMDTLLEVASALAFLSHVAGAQNIQYLPKFHIGAPRCIIFLCPHCWGTIKSPSRNGIHPFVFSRLNAAIAGHKEMKRSLFPLSLCTSI